MHVNQSVVQFFIERARAVTSSDADEARSWLLTSTAFLPDCFEIQFECYLLNKKCRDAKQAARHLAKLCRAFGDQQLLLAELSDVIGAVRQECLDQEKLLLRHIFCHMSEESQLLVLSMMAERTSDTLEHTQLLLLLLQQFPHMTETHAIRIVDSLLEAEQQKFHQKPLNPYRKCLVVDVLPAVLHVNSSCFSRALLVRLFLLSLEFYSVCQLADYDKSLSAGGDCWRCGVSGEQADHALTSLLHALSGCLNWPLGVAMFSQARCRELLWQQLLSFYTDTSAGSSSCGLDSPAAVEQLVFCALALLLQCVVSYTLATETSLKNKSCGFSSSSGDNSGAATTAASSSSSSAHTNDSTASAAAACTPLYLVPAFHRPLPAWSRLAQCGASLPGAGAGGGPLQQRRRSSGATATATPTEVLTTVSRQRVAPLGTDPVAPLTCAAHCLKLLHAHRQLSSVLHDVWLSTCWTDFGWFGSFLLAVQVFVADWTGVAASVPARLQLPQLLAAVAPPRGTLAQQCHKCLLVAHAALSRSDVKCCVEVCVRVVSTLLPSVVGNQQLASLLTTHVACSRHNHLLAHCRVDIVSYCVKLLVAALQMVLLESARQVSDSLLGNLMVLLQYDWPAEQDIFFKLIECIKVRGRLVYPPFSVYVTCADIIEQLVFVSTEDGGSVQLVLRSSQNTRMRTMATRGVDKGAREEFRAAMLSQLQRHETPLSLMVQFISTEGASLIQCVS